ncbi:NAD(P)/FAD-dependent oxidoreductase [Streptomyces winkii]|uniref:NAD(P)/FAD-dependent oxidoreductase n=1 Tax=Streptomyces winkii TaxID=3051178 RepID=UPI0028D6D7E1|nr:NAD(P)/FAD-dependent oxidoreductase [Streptomyces sp. DSM 40971]
MFDAIVVGARCAGSPTAMLLARAGHRVLLVDRSEPGSDTLSTHVIHQPGVAALARWGLLARVLATGCPPLDRVLYRVEDIRLEGSSHGVDGQSAGYAPRRHVLDPVLAEAAVESGAEFRSRCSVTGLLRGESGRVRGVRLRHRGREFTEQARLVIGADGMRSTVATLCGAGYTEQTPRLTCAYYAYWEGVPTLLELYERPGGWVASVPTNDGATLVLAYLPQSRFEEVRADSTRAYLDQIRATAPALFERLQGKRRIERLRGTGHQENFFRQAAGPGWALVGDAGHHKDSITARGITDAFLQAESLAEHIGDELADEERLDESLQAYARKRDDSMAEGYRAALSAARLEIHPKRLSLLRAVQSDPGLTSTYFDVFAGIRPPTALYTPQLLARL